MSQFLYNLRGVISFLFIILNTLIHATPFFPLALVKLLLPFKLTERQITRMLDMIGESWISANKLFFSVTRSAKIQVEGSEGLSRKDWYLCIANHQSWVDILVIQFALNRKIPFLKFFLKKELIWIPVMGLAWKAMDFPFMSRHTKEQIKKNPSLAGKDIEATKKACQIFEHKPVSIMNFVEGTRFRKAKHEKQNSPYKYLLKPKSGGVAFVLEALGGKVSYILDITLCYEGSKNFWDFLCGKTELIKIHIDPIKVDEKYLGSYQTDDEFRASFQSLITDIWKAKDEKIEGMMS